MSRQLLLRQTRKIRKPILHQTWDLPEERSRFWKGISVPEKIFRDRCLSVSEKLHGCKCTWKTLMERGRWPIPRLRIGYRGNSTCQWMVPLSSAGSTWHDPKLVLRVRVNHGGGSEGQGAGLLTRGLANELKKPLENISFDLCTMTTRTSCQTRKQHHQSDRLRILRAVSRSSIPWR